MYALLSLFHKAMATDPQVYMSVKMDKCLKWIWSSFKSDTMDSKQFWQWIFSWISMKQ